MFKQLKEDLDSIMERDPAARSRLEVYLLYSARPSGFTDTI